LSKESAAEVKDGVGILMRLLPAISTKQAST
jgi:hypothetical protein